MSRLFLPPHRRKHPPHQFQEPPASRLQRLLERLSLPVHDVVPVRAGLAELRQLLDCVFLDTNEYNMARSRIANAERFLASEERGATRYELQMLVNGLRSHLNCQTKPSCSASARALDASRSPWG